MATQVLTNEFSTGSADSSAQIIPPPPPPHFHILSGRGFTVVRLVLGTLLLTTSILKLTGGSGEIMRTALPFVSPKLLLLGVLLEGAVGIWLLTGLFAAVASLMVLISFAFFAGISFELGIDGQSSCCCFGSLRLSPWHSLAIDVLAITCLLYFHLALNHGRLGLWLLALILIAIGTFSLIHVARQQYEQDVSHSLLTVIQPPPNNVVMMASSQRSWPIAIRNSTSLPVSIRRISNSCECYSIALKRWEIPAGEKIEGEVFLDLNNKPDFRGDLSVTSIAHATDAQVAFVIRQRVTVSPSQRK